MNFTELENQLIEHLIDSEFGHGGNYVYFDEWDMKTTRGVIASLVKKEIIEIDWANSSRYSNDISNPGVEYLWLCFTGKGIKTFPEE